MTYQELFTLYNGKPNVGNTSENKGECVGLVAAYVEALGLPHIWGNACDLFVNADEKFFEKILNTPDAIIQAGDIPVWSKKFNGTVGHTGVAAERSDINTFDCFEANDPLGSPCHIKTYNYDFIIGWLRPIQPQNEQTLTNELRADRDKNWNLYQNELQAKIQLEDAVASKQRNIDVLTKENLALKDEILATDKDKQTYLASLQKLTTNLENTRTELSVCTGLLSNRKDLGKYTTGELVKEILGRFHL